MKYNQLGKSDLKVSEISLGCMSFGDDQKAITQLVDLAIDKGINFFDTADLYDRGENEIRLATALKNKRPEVIIATKVGNQWKTDGSSWDWNPRKAYIVQAVEASLKRLNTDYIDLYQLHGGTIDDPIDESIEAFEQLKQQGKIRAYGISSIRPNVIRRYAEKSNMDSVMMQYSLLDRRPEESCLGLLDQYGISVITRGTLAKGLLVNKPAKSYLGHSEQIVNQAKKVIQAVATGNNKPSSLTACEYVLQNKTIASAVIGFRTSTQLSDCLNGKSVAALAEANYQNLQSRIPANIYEKHR